MRTGKTCQTHYNIAYHCVWRFHPDPLKGVGIPALIFKPTLAFVKSN